MSVCFGELPLYPNTIQLKVSQCDKKEKCDAFSNKKIPQWE